MDILNDHLGYHFEIFSVVNLHMLVGDAVVPVNVKQVLQIDDRWRQVVLTW